MNTNFSRQPEIFKQLFRDAQRKTYTLLFTTIVVTILLFLFAVRPAIIKISEIQSEIDENRILQERLQTKLNTLNDLSLKYEQNKDKIALLEQALPQTAGTESLVANLNELALKSNLIMTGIEFDTKVDPNAPTAPVLGTTPTGLVLPEGILSFKTNVTVIGDYNETLNFVKDIEAYPRILHVTAVKSHKIISSSSSSSRARSTTSTAGLKPIETTIEILGFYRGTRPKTN